MANWDTYVNASPVFSLSDTHLRDDVSQAADEDRIEGATLGQELAYILGAFDANTEDLAGTKTLTDADIPVQYLNPDGSGRDVNLPAEAAANHIFIIVNTADAAEDLTIKDDSPATIITVGQNEAGVVVSDGTDWKGFVVATTAGGAGKDMIEIQVFL